VADIRVSDPTKDTSVKRDRTSTSAAWGEWKQSADEDHLIGGYTSGRLGQLIGLIGLDFGPQLIDVKKVVKAELHVFTADDHTGFKGQSVGGTVQNLKVSLARHLWTTVNSGENNWSGNMNQPEAINDPDPNYVAYGHIHNVGLFENIIDISNLMRPILPESVLSPNGQAGLGRRNDGLHLTVSGGEPERYEREWVFASKDHPNVAIRPFVTLTVDLIGGPGIVRLTSPDGDVAAGSDVFLRGEYEPGVPGDVIAQVRVVITDPATGDWVWDASQSPDSTDIATSTFAVKVVPDKLKSGTQYEWTARVANQDGDVTPFATPKAAIRYLSTKPTLSTPSAPVGTMGNLLGKAFKTTWFSNTQRASVVRTQLRSYIAPTDPTWDEDLIWDSGRVTVPSSLPLDTTPPPPYRQSLSMSYGGPLLPPGTYVYRMQAKDYVEGESDWVYGQVVLTDPYVDQPGGSSEALTQYHKGHPPFRICIYKMGVNRGPGVLAAELSDASNIGASEYYNAGGEFYFTLPATHPQVAVIEPYQVHYSLDIHTSEGWRPKAFGLITDFDASEDEVVFYGQDYLAILARMVDERFDPTNADLTTDKGGAKYSDKSIDFIIRDQLEKARTSPNSPVAFISVGDIPVMTEKVTIYTSFKQRLPFIAGLIDSYRAGTGRKTRIVCERDVSGAYKWRVLNDPGVDRDNLKMEYGGLIQGFRTVPFSGWGTAVDAIGRTVLGTKVYSDRKVAPGISEGIYGAWPTTTMYQDIDDINDLRRRTAQAAAQVAKVGKLMGLGIRVGSLGIKDMWDICDSVPIHINQGIVDTRPIDPTVPGVTRWGSGYWTIWGWNWQSYPDGHADLNLTLAPRQDTVPPNPDLIASKPIIDTPEWGIGSGPPITTQSTCSSPTPSGTYGPNNSGNTPAGGHAFYFRAGLGGPPEVGPYAGAWHFPEYGVGGAPDVAGQNVGNSVFICVRGPGKLTINTVGAGTIGYDIALSNSGPWTTGGSVAAGTPIVITFGDAGGTECVHWVQMGMSNGAKNGYAGMVWASTATTPPTTTTDAHRTYIDTDTGEIYEYDTVTGEWVATGTSIYGPDLVLADLPPIPLDYLSDVDTVAVPPTNGQALVWDGTTSLWKPGTIVPPSSLDTILTTTGDMVYRPGATNYATAAQGASVSAGGNVGSLANIIDGNDATYFGTFNFQSASATVDLGQVRAIGGFRAKLLGGSSTGVTVSSGPSSTGPWTSQKVQAKDGSGVAQGSLPATASARYWKFDVNGHDGYEVDWYTIEVLAGASPARLPIGTTGQHLEVVGGVPAWATPATGGSGGGGAGNPASGARAVPSAVTASPHNTWTSIAFAGTDRWDTDAFHNPASNNTRMTIPAGMGGRYSIGGTVSFVQGGGGRSVRVMLNGTTRIGGESLVNAASSSLTRLSASTIYDLAAGDYVELQAWQDTGGALNTEVGANFTEFWITRLDGVVGPAGAAGPAGPPGADGAVGATGPAGADGAVGPVGPPGADGADGADGVSGTLILDGDGPPADGTGAPGDYYLDTTNHVLYGPKAEAAP